MTHACVRHDSFLQLTWLIHIYKPFHTHIFKCINTYIRIHINMYVSRICNSRIHSYIYVYIHTYICMYMYTHTYSRIYTYVYTIHTFTHKRSSSQMCASVCVSVCVRERVCRSVGLFCNISGLFCHTTTRRYTTLYMVYSFNPHDKNHPPRVEPWKQPPTRFGLSSRCRLFKLKHIKKEAHPGVGGFFRSGCWFQRVSYRVAKIHRMPYLYRSFSANDPLIIGLFCRKWPVKIRHPMDLRHPVCRYEVETQCD